MLPRKAPREADPIECAAQARQRQDLADEQFTSTRRMPNNLLPIRRAPGCQRRPRQYKRVGFAVIDETLAHLQLQTRTELARMLGVADNTVGGWAKKGEVRASVELACHGLRSLGQPAPEPHQEPGDIVIVRLRADKKDALVSMLDAMEVDYRQI